MSADRSWEARADRLAADAIAAGEPTGWFERLYGEAKRGEVPMPWNRRGPQPLLAEWAVRRAPQTGSALVVGCGLGADAEFISDLGLLTTAFDVSQSAVELATARHPDSVVRYAVADVLAPPPAWSGAFDLVVEVYTLQALPPDLRPRAAAAIAGFVAPGGVLLVIAAARDDDAPPGPGPPWPLTRSEIEGLACPGLGVVAVERIHDGDDPRFTRWRAELRRPA
ncbi:MAG: class I SAM-dependent methyltransferase [Thermoleophilia bacterium]